MRECPREALASITNSESWKQGSSLCWSRWSTCWKCGLLVEAGRWTVVTVPWLWEDPLCNLLAQIYHRPPQHSLNTIYQKFTVSAGEVSIPVPLYEDKGYLSSRWAKGNSHRPMLGIPGSFLIYASSFFDRRKCLLYTLRGPEEKDGGPNCLWQVGIGKVAVSGLEILLGLCL